jgi:hypothetical protein
MALAMIEFLTTHALARQSGSADVHVARWCKAANVPSRKENGHTVFQKEAALAEVRLHQRNRPAGSPADARGLAALAGDMAHQRRVGEVRSAILKCVADCIGDLATEIENAAPPGDVPVPESAPEFGCEQRAWLLSRLQRPFDMFYGSVPDEIQADLKNLKPISKR